MTATHTPTGNPATVAAVGTMARDIMEHKAMPNVDGFSLAAIDILAMELSVALSEIRGLKEQLNHIQGFWRSGRESSDAQ